MVPASGGGYAFKPGKGLSPSERDELVAARAIAAAWLEPIATVTDVEDAVMPIVTTMASKDPGGYAGYKAAGYLIALGDLPRAALGEACLKVLRDEAGLDDVHYAPTPPELRRLALAEAKHVESDIGFIDRLLAARELKRGEPGRSVAVVEQPVPVPAPASGPAPGYGTRVVEELARRRAARSEGGP